MSRLRELIEDFQVVNKDNEHLAEMEFTYADREKISPFTIEINIDENLFYIPQQKKFYQASRNIDEYNNGCDNCEKKGYSYSEEENIRKCKEYIFEFEGKRYIQAHNCIINYDFKVVEVNKRESLKILLSKKYVLVTGEYLM